MQPDEQEETAESLGLMLEEHIAECGTCAAGEPCDEADELVVSALEWHPYPTDGRAELGGEG